MRDYCIIHLSLEDQGKGVPPPALVESAAIGLVVLQSAEILWLIICFAMHFYA